MKKMVASEWNMPFICVIKLDEYKTANVNAARVPNSFFVPKNPIPKDKIANMIQNDAHTFRPWHWPKAELN